MTGCEALAGAALFDCLAAQPACLPPQHPPVEVLREVARRESGFRPLALRDETTGREVRVETHAGAVREITERRRKGHALGVGMFQSTHHENHRRLGLLDAQGLPTLALDPCRAMRAGAAHLAEDIEAALADRVLAAALSRYNSGTLTGAPGYAAAVLVRLRRSRSASAAQDAAGAAPAVLPPPPKPCAPVWDAWATARCNARLTRASTPAQEKPE